jgi:hypothetical protein
MTQNQSINAMVSDVLATSSANQGYVIEVCTVLKCAPDMRIVQHQYKAEQAGVLGCTVKIISSANSKTAWREYAPTTIRAKIPHSELLTMDARAILARKTQTVTMG